MSDLAGRRYEFVDGLLPLVVMVNHASLVLEDVEPVFGHYRALVQRRVRYVSVTDAREVKSSTDARTRRALAEASKRMEDDSERWSFGNAIVVSSAIVRGALTAIEWISQPKHPMVYFSSMPAALDWAIEKIEAAGLEVTPAIRRFRAAAR